MEKDPERCEKEEDEMAKVKIKHSERPDRLTNTDGKRPCER